MQYETDKMVKIVIVYFNFSSCYEYPLNNVSSGLSIYSAELNKKKIGSNKIACNCGDIKERTIEVIDRHDSYFAFLEMKELDGRSIEEMKLNNKLLYKLLKECITEKYIHSFDFENQNMAVYMNDDQQFDDVCIYNMFKKKLEKHYLFKVNPKTESIRKKAESSIPFNNIDDKYVRLFGNWVSVMHPTLL